MQKCKNGFSVVGIQSQSKAYVAIEFWCSYSLPYLRCFHRILNMLVSKEFYGTYVRLPTNEVPPEIRENPKFFPYFRHAMVHWMVLFSMPSSQNLIWQDSVVKKVLFPPIYWQPVFSVCVSAIF